MDRLKKSRTPVRASFTKLLNQIEAGLKTKVIDSSAMVASHKSLQLYCEKLQGLDNEVKEAMLDEDCSDETLMAEAEVVDSFVVKWMYISERVASVIKHTRSPSPSECISEAGTSEGRTKRTFKLPKIELRKFNGELREWLGFWSQFSKIDEDETLHPTDKFHYLIQALEGKEPRALVSSYPQTAANYPLAVEALKKRFGNEGLLVQVYVREILNLVITNVTKMEKLSLTEINVRLQSHLRSLSSLNLSKADPSTWLFPLVESSLPEELLRVWQRSPLSKKDGKAENPPKSNLDYLMEFIDYEDQNEQRIRLAQKGFANMSIKEREKDKTKPNFQSKTRKNRDQDIPTAACLFSGHSNACIFCEKPHESSSCGKAIDMTLNERNHKVKEKNACYNCLKTGHGSKKCKAYIKCIICAKRHTTLMCPEAQRKSEKEKEAEVVQSTSTGLNCTSEVMLQTLSVSLVNDGKSKTVRVLCDPGSQRSYILKKTTEDMVMEPVGKIKLCHYLFGGSTELKEHNKFKVKLDNPHSAGMIIEVLDTKQICGAIPRMKKGPFLSELRKNNIWIQDLGRDTPTIELLIGSDYYGKLLTGKKYELENGLVALETKFGWTLSGKIDTGADVAMSVTSMLVLNSEVSDLWDLELIGIQDPSEHKSKTEREEETKQHFSQSVTRSGDGRYCVKFPWINNVKHLIPDNRSIAEARLASATRKLEIQGQFETYHEIFQSWLREDIIETVDSVPNVPCHYLPHRPVFKPSSLTTPVRPVYDASCKSKRSPSLNECLEKGPNLLEKIPSILLRFRENAIGLTSDIRKAFQMIEVAEEDKDFQRFLWWEDLKKKSIRVYRHKRVVFGINCSPYLLGAVLEHHLHNVSEGEKEITTKLLKSLYVDNCVTSVQSVSEYEEFREKTTQILAQAKMELRQWEFGSSLQGKAEIPVLGLIWNKVTDMLKCDLSFFDIPSQVTKRQVLSMTHQIFDPIGFMSPVLVIPKLVLQEAWASDANWDEELSDNCKGTFLKWCEELPVLQQIEIPRWINPNKSDELSVHTFCDASRDAYGAVIFLRSLSEDQTSIRFIQAKTRIAPLKMSKDKSGVRMEKRSSIPRLELLAATIAARLTHNIKTAMNWENLPCYFWSDSKTVLAWISRNNEWGTFVGNRIKEILKLTNSSDWYHVPGNFNPADLPSRGCSPRQLCESKWWEGPEWLLRPQEEWPAAGEKVDEDEVEAERKKSTRTLLNVKSDVWFKPKFSNYLKNIRLMGWVRRFIQNASQPRESRNSCKFLSIQELRRGEFDVLRFVQGENFPNGIGDVKTIKVKIGEDGLIRVESKLTYKADSMEFRQPILLSHKHYLVEQLIQFVHITNCHAGTQFVLGRLREKYWILQGRKSVGNIIRKCVTCKRYSTNKLEVETAPLPKNRVDTEEAFQVTGVDLAGPLYLKEGNKVWITLFTCAVYRTIHLDLVSSLNTEAFLNSLERFINTHGRPNIVYSDNGTNFIGTVNLFRKLDKEKIERESQVKMIQWIFNPPTAAWWGGWWERLVQSVKGLLRRMLGRAKLTMDELRTCLSSVEATINSRPLTTIMEDEDDLIPLTPAMFTRGLKNTAFPEATLVTSRDFQLQFKRIQNLKFDLQARFRREYLALLVQKANEKQSKTPEVGDVVLVGADNKKRFNWPLGRIVELIPGRDGQIRVAKVKTGTGIVTRPLQRLYPLEIPRVCQELQIPKDVKKIALKERKLNTTMREEVIVTPNIITKTKSGRKVVRPRRYGQWNNV